jgi:hypothetical protein
MHSRMRHRVAEFLKVLNRAKPEEKDGGAARERKTARLVHMQGGRKRASEREKALTISDLGGWACARSTADGLSGRVEERAGRRLASR